MSKFIARIREYPQWEPPVFRVWLLNGEAGSRYLMVGQHPMSSLPQMLTDMSKLKVEVQREIDQTETHLEPNQGLFEGC